MKKTLLSMLMMGSALMANAQQTINVEFLNGDMDDDDQITVNDVTNLIGAYLEGTTPIKSITVDNTEVMDKIDYLFNWNYKQDDAIATNREMITTNCAAIANNSYKIEDNSYKIANNSAAIANNSTYIKQNVEDIKKNSDDIKELQRNITALAGVISKMEADNAMMQVMIDSQQNDIKDLKNKNAQLQESVEILESQNRELRTAVANINNFVDELNRRIQNLENQINQ